MRASRVTIVLAMLCALGGCAHRPQPYQSGYETVAIDPRRDAQAAQREDLRAMGLLEKGQLEHAETAARQALTADVMYGPAHNTLGKVYYCQQKLYLAAWEFQYAIRLMPAQAEPQNNLGLVYEAAGKPEEALPRYEKAISLDPEQVQYLGNAARARIKLGRRDGETRRLLEQIVLRDSRPAWQQWAKRELTLVPLPPASQPGVTQP